MFKIRFLFTACLSLAAWTASAQRGNIGYIYPPGGQCGTTFEVTVGGQNIRSATEVVVSGDGVTAVLLPSQQQPPRARRNRNIGEEDNLQLADQVKFKVTIAAGAKPGIRDFRLKTPAGTTNRLYFEVGALPDVLEKEPNDVKGMRVEKLPATLCGQIMRSDVDRFTFSAKKGENLVFRVQARRLVPYLADAVPGWFQPVMRILDEEGKELAYCDDYYHEVDPVIFFEVPRTADYTVEIRDALYRGRADFVYRIDAGELPFITSIYPLGGPAGKKTKIELRGVNLPSSSYVVKDKPQNGKLIPVNVTAKNGYVSNTLFYEYGEMRERALDPAKTNYTRETAMALSDGDAVNAVFDEPFRTHWYKIDMAARGRMTFEVDARRLGAPTDACITLFDASGKNLKMVDDVTDGANYLLTHHADPVTTYYFRAAGTYYLRVHEMQSKGGPEYAYRFKYYKSVPDFELRLDPATISLSQGGTAAINVMVDRKQNFNGEIDLEIRGLPKGYKVSSTKIPTGVRRIYVTVTAPVNAEQQVLMPTVVGTAKAADGQIVTRVANPVEPMLQAFYLTHYMPLDELRVEVGEELPFSIVLESLPDPLPLKTGDKVPVKIKAIRKDGFNDKISLLLRSSETSVRADAVVIEEGQNEAVMYIQCRPNRNQKTVYPVAISGVLRGTRNVVRGNSFTASMTQYAPAFLVEVPARPKTTTDTTK